MTHAARTGRSMNWWWMLACGPWGAPTREEVRSAVGFALPPSARQLQLRNINVGLRDSRTEVSFDIDPADRADLGARSGCLLVEGENTANCLSRRLHTEQSITITHDGGWDHVSIETAEYDNCLFEGCPNPTTPLAPAQRDR